MTAQFRKLPWPLPEAQQLDRILAATSGPLIVSPRRSHTALQRQVQTRLDRYGFVVLAAPVDCRRSMRSISTVERAFSGRNLYCLTLDGEGKTVLAESARAVSAVLEVVLGPAYVPHDVMSREVLQNMGLAKERGFRPATRRPASDPAAGRPGNR